MTETHDLERFPSIKLRLNSVVAHMFIPYSPKKRR